MSLYSTTRQSNLTRTLTVSSQSAILPVHQWMKGAGLCLLLIGLMLLAALLISVVRLAPPTIEPTSDKINNTQTAQTGLASLPCAASEAG